MTQYAGSFFKHRLIGSSCPIVTVDLNNENSLAGGTGLSQATQVSLCAAAEAPANCSSEREKHEKKPAQGIQEKPLSGIMGDTTVRVPIPDDGVINYYKPAVPRFLPAIQSADSCEKSFTQRFKGHLQIFSAKVSPL